MQIIYELNGFCEYFLVILTVFLYYNKTIIFVIADYEFVLENSLLNIFYKISENHKNVEYYDFKSMDTVIQL